MAVNWTYLYRTKQFENIKKFRAIKSIYYFSIFWIDPIGLDSRSTILPGTSTWYFLFPLPSHSMMLLVVLVSNYRSNYETVESYCRLNGSHDRVKCTVTSSLISSEAQLRFRCQDGRPPVSVLLYFNSESTLKGSSHNLTDNVMTSPLTRETIADLDGNNKNTPRSLDTRLR